MIYSSQRKVDKGEVNNVEKTPSFADVLEAADQLPLDDQEMLAEVLHRRVVAERRNRLVAEVREAQEEYQKGEARPTSPDELMAEILE
jgi:hypothetical protein